MKKIYLLLIGLCFVFSVKAQVSKTVELTPGNLKALLTSTEKNTVTNLTINGIMDARDFKFMRDSMPVLAVIDMSSATVDYYAGNEGPMSDIWNYEYPANKVPSHAFCQPGTYIGKTTLTSVKLPHARAVLYNSFWGCTNLQTVVFPSTVTTIGDGAFRNCPSLVNMEIPPFLKSLERYVFMDCNQLSSVTIPATIESIKDNVFYNCTGLSSIHIISHTPEDFNNILNYFGTVENMFYNVDKEHCILYVPYGTKELYQTADGWKDFKNIVEDSKGFILSADNLQFSSSGGSNYSIHISANTHWTAVSDEPWLTVSPSSGNGNAIFNITAEANTLDMHRQAIITITAEGLPESRITVFQETDQDILNVTPGGLSAMLDAVEKSKITSLTLAGEIDARDFKTMRDEMPQLASIDLRQTTIVAYNGMDGTAPAEWGAVSYANNSIPAFALGHAILSFQDNKTILSVQIPSTVTSIGPNAFDGCNSLGAINIPSGITFIGESAFSRCYSLSGPIILPDGIKNIENYTFFRCINLTSVKLPAALDSIKPSAFDACFAMSGNMILPSTVRYVGERAFANCRSLNGVLDLPPLLTTIESFAFVDCRSLSSIRVRNPIPVPLLDNSTVFELVNKSIPLKVPVGTKDRYAHSTVWMDFTNIMEDESILSDSYLSFGPEGGNSSDILLNTNVAWTAISEQPWLTISPSEGNSNTTLVITAETSQLKIPRRATILINAEGLSKQAIVVEQGANPGSLAITPGSLASVLNEGERSLITSLTLTGEMDARDFKTIREELPFLTYLDLEKVDIVAYTDYTFSNNILYPANTIPAYPWDQMLDNITFFALAGHRNLKTLLLPESLTTIGRSAFRGCYGLHAVKLPSSLERIEDDAFIYCAFLDSISLPSSITHIGRYAFHSCSRMVNIDLKANITAITEGAFSECRAITTIDIPESVTSIGENAFLRCDLLQTIVIPNGVTKIGLNAFATCPNLYSVIIPSSVSVIDSGAFYDCTGLHEIYAFPSIPPDLTDSPEVFGNVNHSEAVLYVPSGSKALYATADQWKDFTNIVESSDAMLDAFGVNLKQLPTATDEILEATGELRFYPNPFTQYVTIEISNPSHKNISVDIFSMTGQKIKTLVSAQKGEKINCVWNGTNQQGQKVPSGIYLLKSNELVKQIVFDKY